MRDKLLLFDRISVAVIADDNTDGKDKKLPEGLLVKVSFAVWFTLVWFLVFTWAPSVLVTLHRWLFAVLVTLHRWLFAVIVTLHRWMH